MKCQGMTKDGHPCTFNAKPGEQYCGLHLAERTRYHGGNRYQIRREKQAVVFEEPIHDLASMQALIAVCTQQAAAGNFNQSTLTAICTACKTQLEIFRTLVFARKLYALEKMAKDDIRYRMYLAEAEEDESS